MRPCRRWDILSRHSPFQVWVGEVEFYEGSYLGWIVVTVLLLGGSSYFGGGYWYNSRSRGLRGIAALPHRQFWIEVAGLVEDGVNFTRETVHGCRHAPPTFERIYRRAPATTRTVYRTPRRLGSAVANASSYGDCVAADHMSLRVVNEASANGMDQEFCHRPFRLVGTYIVALEYTHMRASHSPMHWSPVLA
jgi:hypothetical protein